MPSDALFNMNAGEAQANAFSTSGQARLNAVMAEELGLLIDGATNHAIYMLDPRAG